MPRIRDRVFVVAEAGVNHNGSLDRALQLVDAAAAAGADAVKFQTFRADAMISRSAAKAEYQKRATGSGESQLEMVRRLELSARAHRELVKRCRSRGIGFLSTPFDRESLRLLTRGLGLNMLKLSSGEVTNAPLLLDAARSGARIVLSTGMCTLGDIETALGILAFGYASVGQRPSSAAFRAALSNPKGLEKLRRKITLLHCTTEYPAPLDDVNLRAMDTLATAFGLPVGYSDHTEGIEVSIAAAARGAVYIEKHFTMDRALPGPDHQASIEPSDLERLVAGVRAVSRALGSAIKARAPSEVKNVDIARKSLVAARPIRRGEAFTVSNLAIKRPGRGVSPIHYWDVLGLRAGRHYAADDLVVPDGFDKMR